jgi:hypothetical protein
MLCCFKQKPEGGEKTSSNNMHIIFMMHYCLQTTFICISSFEPHIKLYDRSRLDVILLH